MISSWSEGVGVNQSRQKSSVYDEKMVGKSCSKQKSSVDHTKLEYTKIVRVWYKVDEQLVGTSWSQPKSSVYNKRTVGNSCCQPKSSMYDDKRVRQE